MRVLDRDVQLRSLYLRGTRSCQTRNRDKQPQQFPQHRHGRSLEREFGMAADLGVVTRVAQPSRTAIRSALAMDGFIRP